MSEQRAITLLVIYFPLVSILAFADFQAFKIGNILLLLVSNLLYAAGIQVWVILFLVKLRNVKRQWKEEHGTG